MKILVVAGWMYPDQEGGSFRVVYEAGRGLAARGHEVHVATQRLREEHPEREELAGMIVHRYTTAASSGPRFYASTARQVPRLVDRLQGEVGFEAVHTHHPVSAYGLHRAKSVRHVPCVAVLHSLYFLEYIDRHRAARSSDGRKGLSPGQIPIAAALRRLDAANLRRSARIVVLSDFTRGLVAEHLPDCLEKIDLLPGGVDLEEFRPEPSRAEARERLGLPTDRPIFFTCRRLEHRMGLLELFGAARKLRDAGRNPLVLIAGRGALEQALAERIERWHAADVVTLLGYVPEDKLPLYYRAADCFVLPTRALEGFGLVTAEAFACGTPVLGTPVGATPELIRPFDPRLLTADATVAGIAEGMTRFLDQVATSPTLSQRCRSYAESRFRWDPFVDGLERISNNLARK